MLASQLVFIGFESPSQFAEETRKADRTVPQAIVWSIIACGVLGGGLVLVLLFCIQVRPHVSICKLRGTLTYYSGRHGSERTSSHHHLLQCCPGLRCTAGSQAHMMQWQLCLKVLHAMCRILTTC